MNRVLTVVLVVAAISAAGCGGGGGGGGNQNPAIASLVGAQQAIWPGASTTITCEASDPDGDTLSFTWTAVTGGTITGSGASITFTAPAVATTGTYQVRCEVSDGRGGNASRTVDVTVGATVQGKVISATTRQPVAGVQIVIAGRVGVTDANGNFSITGVPEGTHRVRESDDEETYTVAGWVEVQVTTPGSTVRIQPNIQVFSGPPPPPF